MLIQIFGASGSGKSTHAATLRALLPGVAVHDVDELPPPDGEWTRAWRREATEHWIERALDVGDLVLAGGVFGELLAAPSAPLLDGIAACLLDCSDDERVRRLRARENGPIDAHELWDHVAWGAWLRFHARDPQWFRGPLVGDPDGWHWDRWSGWRESDRRWTVHRIDTTGVPIDEAADAIAEWVRAQQRLRDEGALPLARGWC